MHILLRKYNFLLFDLDDTLYAEKDYLYQGYKSIDEKFSHVFGLQEGKISEFLISNFESAGRKKLFNKLFDRFDIDEAHLTLILHQLRTFTPKSKLQLFPDLHEKLPKILDQSERVFVVTNGNPIQQENKVKNIDWKGMSDQFTFIYANKFAPKPAVHSFNFIKQNYVIDENDTIMIGDSNSDFEYAQNCGIDFMHVDDFRKF